MCYVRGCVAVILCAMAERLHMGCLDYRYRFRLSSNLNVIKSEMISICEESVNDGCMEEHGNHGSEPGKSHMK